MKGKRGNPGLKGRLVAKSLDAYVLSLETINRLSVKYRVETFCYLLCNAWELLCKAKIIDTTGTRDAIYYARQPGMPPRTLSLRDCLNRVFPQQTDPTRSNIERMADLRDEAVHLVLTRVPRDITGLFQASVLNYHRRLVEWFGVSLSERLPVGMMTIVYDLRPEESDLSSAKLRRELGREAAEFLARFQAKVLAEFDRLQRPAEFSLGIEYQLVLTKRPSEADIALTCGPGGPLTRVVEIAKAPSSSHPFRQKELVAEVNRQLGAKTINGHDIQCVNRAYGARDRPDFFYKGSVPGSPSQYSQAFVDWLLARYRAAPAFFADAREKDKTRTRS